MIDSNHHVERAGVDLMRESVLDALAATHFDRDEPACFVLEGLIHYLPRARVEALLSDLSSGSARREVIVSFIRTQVYESARGPLRWLVQLLGEIPRLHFAPRELEALAARHGFARFQSWTFDQQVTAFAPVARTRRVGCTQDVALLRDRA